MKKTVLILLSLLLAGCGSSAVSEAPPVPSREAESTSSAETDYVVFSPEHFDSTEVKILIPSTWNVKDNSFAYMDLCYGTFSAVSSSDESDGLAQGTFQAVVEAIAKSASDDAAIDYFRYEVLDDSMGDHPYGIASYSFQENNAAWAGLVYVIDLNRGYIVLDFRAMKGADYTDQCEQEAGVVLSHLQFQEKYEGDGEQYVKMYEKYISDSSLSGSD